MIFRDRPYLAERIEKYTNYVVLDTAQLSQKLNDELLIDLCSAELEQIRYWTPQYISELVFNWWD